MNEETWDDDVPSKPVQQQQATVQKLGIGRGKLSAAPTNNEAAPVSRWESNSGATNTFGGFRNNSNENSKPAGESNFASRSTGNSAFGARSEQSRFNSNNEGKFRSGNDGSSRTFDRNETERPERHWRDRRSDNNRDGHGGFNSGTGDQKPAFRSLDNTEHTFRNMRVQDNEDGDTKSGFGKWRGRVANTGDNNNDNSDNAQRPRFENFGAREGTTAGSGGFRGGRFGPTSGEGGRFNAGDRETRGNDNCFNCNKPGHRSRECPEPSKRNRDGGSGGAGSFFGRAQKTDKVSDDIFDQAGGRSGPQQTERYVPPPAPTNEADIFGEAVAKGENFGKYNRTQVRCTPEGRVKPVELYEEANLSTQILSNIRRAHFEEPTTIQRYALPCIRQQDDLMACAQTGSGKTAAFLLPIISNLLECHADEIPERFHPPSPLCLVISPTRELALQTEREARKFAYQTPVVPCSAVGGLDMFTVSDRLREGCHILSATTGRLKDMIEKGRVSLKRVKYFVLDEADRMLDTGFEPDIRKLEDLGLPPKEERITCMFSATFPDEVQRLARHFLRENYIFLAVGILGGANEDIAQTIELVPQASKKDRLFELLEKNLKSERCLIFVETKRSADYIGALLSQRNFMSTTMHGDRTQRQRVEAVQQFTNGKCPILVATSVAARGLDFPLIGYVINYDLPDTSDFYIHRIGRTGRAGHLGKSISFFDPNRDSDRTIAPELVQKLTEAGQSVPEFLQNYTSGGGQGSYHGGFPSKSTDMRSNTSTYNKAAAPSGGSANAGAAEDWD